MSGGEGVDPSVAALPSWARWIEGCLRRLEAGVAKLESGPGVLPVEQEWMRKRVAAKYCGTSLSNFETWIREGEMCGPRCRKGRSDFWKRSDLDEWMGRMDRGD